MSTRDEIQPLLEMLIPWDRLWPEDDPVGADWLAERDRRVAIETLRSVISALIRERADEIEASHE